MALFANSTIGLGKENVKGLNLVPKPPTKIKAFIDFKKYFYKIYCFGICNFFEIFKSYKTFFFLIFKIIIKNYLFFIIY